MLKFTKMHGLGNDFVVIDAVRQTVCLNSERVKKIADRHFGVGCDQLLLVEPPLNTNADFRYRIFNADGSEVSQCGNGARCFARFVYEQGLCDKPSICVDTGSGQLIIEREADGNITVNMGIPRHEPGLIPMRIDKESNFYQLNIEGETWNFGAVSMGNPHAVLQVENVETAPVKTLGSILESHNLFPERANIGFMQVEDRHNIRLRVFERGSGETLACGSGACAAVVIGIEQDILDDPVQVLLPGGLLRIKWKGRDTPVHMTGPAVTVFEGMIDI